MRIRNEPTVFVIDDDDAIRSAVRFLMRTAGLNVETYESAESFLEQYDQAWAGCLVVDVRMPGMNGLELQRELKGRGVATPLIFMTGHGDIPMAVEAMKMGAAEFIEKPFKNEELLQKVKQCIKYDQGQRQEESGAQEVKHKVHSLTPREREVMRLLVQGLRNKVIAVELGISSRTVEAHRSNIMDKLGVHSLSEMVRIAIEMEGEAG